MAIAEIEKPFIDRLSKPVVIEPRRLARSCDEFFNLVWSSHPAKGEICLPEFTDRESRLDAGRVKDSVRG